MADGMQTGTAIDAWDKRWATDTGRADWLDPHPAVVALLPELKARGAATALDLGCGVGRHALLLAETGFAVEAFDGSATGLDVVRGAAAARGLKLRFKHGNADALPYADGSFDFVLSWNVIYHGTMLPTRNSNYGIGRRIAPDTFVVDGAEERGHPHFYCDAPVLVSLFSGFELLSLTQTQQQKPGSWHWNIVAERLPG
jgi:tellurite methyltransferase